MGDIAVEVALSIRAEHAKGPLWDAATARLWWVDINGQRVHCSDLASGNDSSWATAGQPGGVLLDAAGEPVVASPRPDLPGPQQDQTRPAGGRCETRVFRRVCRRLALACWWRSRGVVRPAGVGGRLA